MMRNIRIVSAILVATILLASFSTMTTVIFDEENTSTTSARSTGVDLKINDMSFSYTNSVDQLKYKMFSSNHPITGFDRPAALFAVDAVINIPIQIQFEVGNIGTTSSGNFNVRILILHNEYADFELHNETIAVSSLNSGSSVTGQKEITPTYSGNHTIKIMPITSIVDDNPSNDMLQETFTVAYSYMNCDDLTGWNVGQEWSSNSDTSISQGYSCHIGNGESSSYSNNLNTALITPPMDMSDAIENPTRTNGLTFFYTGSILSGDVMKVYINDINGAWTEMASLSGTIDQVFSDGSTNWQTWSVNNAGANSPLIPAPQMNFNSQTKFKFDFTSDSANNDIGLWMDDIVIVYDQKIRQEEFGLITNGISNNGAVPGSWGSLRVEMTNTGNITETFRPSMIDVPTDWNMYYSNPSGVSINPNNGIILNPGESKQIDIHFQPDADAVQGLYQVTFKGSSFEYSSVESLLAMQFQVIPDRIPQINPPNNNPSCQPGNTCTFNMGIENVGEAPDVFELTIDSDDLPIGWSVALAWSQSSNILSLPGSPSEILMIFTVPSDALPDSVGKFKLRVTSQNDSSRYDIHEVELSASMISDAHVEMTSNSFDSDWSIEPGETKTIFYTIWNNASSQDLFSASIIVQDIGLWSIVQPPQTEYVINSGKTSVFSISITAPESAQTGDVCPTLTPSVTSSRSSSVFVGAEFNDIEVSRQDDLTIRLIEQSDQLIPGTENLVQVEIKNNGNGPNDAKLELDGIPDSWSWRLMMEEDNISNPIPLSAIYDLEDVKIIDIWITPLSTTLAGNLYQWEIIISSYDGTFDNNESDNKLLLQSLIEVNRNLVIESESSIIKSGIGNNTIISATLQNLGNTRESNVKIRGQISTLDGNLAIESYFSIGDNGLLFELDQYHNLNLEIGDSYNLSIEIKIPEYFKINSIIIVKFEVQSMDENGPMFQTVETMITVDYRRSMDVDFSSDSNDLIIEGNTGNFWVNLTSTSTISESFTLTTEIPAEWQSICSGILMNSSGLVLEKLPGHIDEQFSSTKCEFLPLNGDLTGQVKILVINSDGTLKWQQTQIYNFEQSSNDGFEFTSDLIAGSIAGVLGLMILTLVILRRRNVFVEDEVELVKPVQSQSGPPVSGPPIQSFANNLQAENQQTLAVPITNLNPMPVNEAQTPPIPINGLPEGWTYEQWSYYGHTYLEKINSGGR